MELLCGTFANVMPAWAREAFFDPQNERSRLQIHNYANSENIRDLRSMDNVELLGMKELPLKSLKNFETALSWVNKSRPGDWPAQFYIRKAVYKSVYPAGKSSKPQNLVKEQKTPGDHYGH